MQLTIDTQKDSQEEIRKAIRLLMSLVGEKEIYTNEAPKDSAFGADSSPSAGAFVDLFNIVSDKKDSSEPKQELKEDDGSSIQFY